MTNLHVTGQNGLDGWGTGLFGEADPVLPASTDGTDGETVGHAVSEESFTELFYGYATGGRGGYGGMGETVSGPYVPSTPDLIDGGNGGHGGNGGSATFTIDDVIASAEVRANARGGQGGHAGYGGNGRSDGSDPGGDGGDGGNGGAGGHATAHVGNITQTIVAGWGEVMALAQAGDGGAGGMAGTGGTGEGPGSPGSAGHGGAGGNAIAETLGNHVELVSGHVSVGAYASAGNGGWGGSGGHGGNWATYHEGYEPLTTPGGIGGSAGFARAEVSGNTVIGGDGANEVVFGAAVYQSVGGLGGFVGLGSDRAASGSDGTGVLTMTGNTVSLGGGNDELQIDIMAFVGTVVTFSGNSFDGGEGFDTLRVSARFIDANGWEAGSIALDLGEQFSGFERVLGGAGADTITTAAGGGTIDGGAGDDQLFGRAGADQLIGGLGFDSLRGGGGTDVLDGGHGNDVLWGNSGDDMLTGGDGDDLLDGVGGIDTARYLSAGTGVTVSLAITTAQDTGGAGIDTLVSIENLVGSGFDDQLTGNSAKNVLEGSAGNDRLEGLAGNDTLDGGDGDDVLDGGAGKDRMSGGAGDDTYYVDDARDQVTELAGEGIDRVIARLDYTLGDNVENLTLKGALAHSGTGNVLANVLRGTSGDDVLSGLRGADTLMGRDGDDTLLGGGSPDRLEGGAGRDTINGGAGDDQIIGGANKDTLIGGSGSDTFFFADGEVGASASSADIVADFDQMEGDKINVRQIDANVGAVGDQNFTFIGADAFTGTAGQIRYLHAGKNTFVEGDTDGDGAADFVIRLDGLIDLTAADFVL